MIEIVYKIGMVPVIAVLGIVLGLLYNGIDRKLAARMQSRVGPPIIQPFIDIKKLLMKESIVPRHAIKWLFNLMPVLALSASLLTLLYIPFCGIGPAFEGYGDLVLVLYLLVLPPLAITLGAFASGSHYATIGAQREMVTMISYELPLAIAIVSVAWLLSMANPSLPVFSLSVISNNPIWNFTTPLSFLGLLIIFIALLLVIPGELGKTPFDVAEAETEIAEGVFAEYSGRNLALFYLANAVRTIAIASLIIAIFLPWNLSTFFNFSYLSLLFDALFFLIKLFVIIFISSVFIRVIVPRLRITQVVSTYWFYTTLIALLGMLLIWIGCCLKG
ncbi:MAG TPA: NADH-quinone oxidoreductase subunit H [Candidatus Aenigmarchaeota archaeon]|nr:MAG: NADH-quinone oxidoreductase subunit H [Candidatus Aenigmarchaeota archaeon]HDD46327.1 NADH-quinone oxidoreductase subunit H [Candidatus Aenigmarchaeota archaeon]